MKYYLLVIASGSLQINAITEWTDVDKAEGAFHDKCKTYANSNDAVDVTVNVIDANFDTVKGLIRHIQHEAKS